MHAQNYGGSNSIFAILRSFRAESAKIFFSLHRVESATFPPGTKTGMWHFQPRCEKKKYTLHGSKIGQPTSRVCYPRLRRGDVHPDTSRFAER